MNKKTFMLIFCLAFIAFNCTKDDARLQKPKQDAASKKSKLTIQEHGLGKASEQGSYLKTPWGTTRINGLGFYAETGECDFPSKGADYALRMTGDLTGCLYVFIEEYNCWGNGIYFEKGREYFVGTYKGKPGTFRTTYKFEAKFEGCGQGGAPAGAEIFGICQHPLVEGSGEGVFAGVTGQLDFWDNVKAVPINFPYVGYFKF
jgi:hypothetical protein